MCFLGAGGGGRSRGGLPPLAGVRRGGGERRGRLGVRRCAHLGQTRAHRRAMSPGRVNSNCLSRQFLVDKKKFDFLVRD
jgi:hypothetical protein